MKVALIGISGRVGSRIAHELLRRGHAVVGVARRIDDMSPQKNLTLVAGDGKQAQPLAPQIKGCDALISAARFSDGPTADDVLTLVKAAGIERLLVVGGAGSLEVAPGKRVLDTPDFPDSYKPEASAGAIFLARLQQEQEVDWTFLSPSAEFMPGQQTGHFRLGHNQLLVDSQGKSWISMEDYAIAMADELEKPQHARQRFTVGY